LSGNKKPSCGGSIGGTGAPGGGSLISDPTDSPLSGAKGSDIYEGGNLWLVSGFSDYGASVGMAKEN
jgi:hypothetical protein